MDHVATGQLWKVKPGKEDEVEAFLNQPNPSRKEPETTSWYAVRIGPSKFGIFDTFPDERGRVAHLTGEIAKALPRGHPISLRENQKYTGLGILASKTQRLRWRQGTAIKSGLIVAIRAFGS